MCEFMCDMVCLKAFESWRHDRADFLRKASEEMVQITLDADLTRVQQGTQVSPY